MSTESESASKSGKTLWAWVIATFFGAGYGKPGPGTWGSVAAALLWAAFALPIPSLPTRTHIRPYRRHRSRHLSRRPRGDHRRARIRPHRSRFRRHRRGHRPVDCAARRVLPIGVTASSLSCSSASSTSPSRFRCASWSGCPAAGASSSTMWPRACMLWL